MLAAVRSAAVLGIDAYDVTVEVDANQGLPQWFIVGLPAASVKESRERVGAALLNSGFVVPPRRVTINLAPADRAKVGTAFDLPIALGVLVATGQLAAAAIERHTFVGELGLDGALRPIRGALPVARRHAERGARGTLVLPPANVGEASLVRSAELSAPASLAELVRQLQRDALAPADRGGPPAAAAAATDALDFADVVGQGMARRALEVAAACGHNVLLVGPPGAGKTMLARRLPGILPPLTEAEALEVTAVHSVAGTLPEGGALLSRPFRAPHHTISTAGLVGGGSAPRPGEASLAHLGVLFLDEMLEFPRHVLDALRQPIEDGRVVIARAATTLSFPARFTLVGAMNPCPCGRSGDAGSARPCGCAPSDVARYRARLSGPLADRFDMHVTVGAVPVATLGGAPPGEPTAAIAERVAAARARQRTRYRGVRGVERNAHAAGRWLDAHGGVESAARLLLAGAAERLALSARGYHRVLKVARTIADLAGEERVGVAAVAEALRYRPASGDTFAAGEAAASGAARKAAPAGRRFRVG